ncbi:MAG: hypothetical protein ACK4JB_22600 [Reyranella sp.]
MACDEGARGQTSVPGIFAAGDATTVPCKQIVIAIGEGARAALSPFDHLIRSAPVEVKEAARPSANTPKPRRLDRRTRSEAEWRDDE